MVDRGRGAVLVAGGESGGEQVVGGAVEVVPAPVVAAGGARVRVAEGVLDVLKCRPEPKRFGGVGVPQTVRRNARGEAGGEAEPGDLLLRGLVAVPGLAITRDEDSAAGAVAEVVVKGPNDGWGEGDPGGLVALAGDLEDAVAVIVAVVPNVALRASEIRRPQNVSSETSASDRGDDVLRREGAASARLR